MENDRYQEVVNDKGIYIIYFILLSNSDVQFLCIGAI